MRTTIAILMAVAAIASTTRHARKPDPVRLQASEQFQRPPIHFEPNIGQVAGRTQWIAR